MASPSGAGPVAHAPVVAYDEAGTSQSLAQVIVEQPDGTFVVGTDQERAPKPASPRPIEAADDFAAAVQRSMLVAQLEAFYRSTTRYRIVFLLWVVADLITFLTAYVAKRAAADRGHVSNSHTVGVVPLSVWLNVKCTPFDVILMSLPVDILGLLGGLQDRSSLVTLYLALQILGTALISVYGLSLFQLWRCLLIAAGFMLRAHIVRLRLLLALSGVDEMEIPPQLAGTPVGWVIGFARAVGKGWDDLAQWVCGGPRATPAATAVARAAAAAQRRELAHPPARAQSPPPPMPQQQHGQQAAAAVPSRHATQGAGEQVATATADSAAAASSSRAAVPARPPPSRGRQPDDLQAINRRLDRLAAQHERTIELLQQLSRIHNGAGQRSSRPRQRDIPMTTFVASNNGTSYSHPSTSAAEGAAR